LCADTKVPENKTSLSEERIIIGGENNGFVIAASSLSPEMLQKFEGKSKEVNAYYIGTTITSCKFLLGFMPHKPTLAGESYAT